MMAWFLAPVLQATALKADGAAVGVGVVAAQVGGSGLPGLPPETGRPSGGPSHPEPMTRPLPREPLAR